MRAGASDVEGMPGNINTAGCHVLILSWGTLPPEWWKTAGEGSRLCC